uniref:Uncharacterized protein n=1 Tax=Salix viminalis TaxID=40686 RepID=A0A6N2KF77_SALVM
MRVIWEDIQTERAMENSVVLSRMFADSNIANSTSSSELPLGILPHQIRVPSFIFPGSSLIVAPQMTLVLHVCTRHCAIETELQSFF